MNLTTVAEAAVRQLVAVWQQSLPPQIEICLGGSLISGTFVEEGARVIDADIRFLTDNPEDPTILKLIEAVTGLKYRKAIQVGDWPQGQSVGLMVEGTLQLTGIDLPVEMEGCLRNRRYVGWHQYYRSVYTEQELAEIRWLKAQFPSKKDYKTFKEVVRAEAQRRALALGLVAA